MSEYDFQVDSTKNNLTILIPSIGRSRVTELIDEITRDALDSNVAIHIIVALNGHQQFKVNNENVRVFDLGQKKIGFSAAVNSVVPFIKTKYVCIVADDDSWQIGKLAHDLALLNDHELVLASYLFIDNIGTSIRPKSLYLGNIPPSQFLYEKFSFARSKRYISISGMSLFTDILRQNAFDSTLLIREDIEWLDRVYKKGHRMLQSNEKTMILSVDLKRANGRETIESLNNWADTLRKNYGDKWVRNFLSGAAIKPFIFVDDFSTVKIITEVAMSKLKARDQVVFLLRKAVWLSIWLGVHIKPTKRNL